ncbi:hypothetical protein BKA64DRAFT_742765 [Cadophora sp. MPI-SDFR-AT-0126]|nr:hypothetical protein BKA64DRAFT_742765 [Leotiomycetes sp. MPI-SDFR-AT-0126]
MWPSISEVVLACYISFAVRAERYVPENGSLLADVNTLPLTYDIAGSQSAAVNAQGSFWSSSYIHGSNNRDYFVISHAAIVPLPFGNSVYRASMLDITSPAALYESFETFSNVSTLFSDNGDFSAQYPDYFFGAANPGSSATNLRTWSTVPDVRFDLNFDFSSQVLLNGGLGTFPGAFNTTVKEWSVPACKTRGWLIANGTNVTVNADKSLTWYDRQWGGAPANWTWFQLHIHSPQPGQPDIPFSIWTYGDATTGVLGFATVRGPVGATQGVIPVKSLKPSSRTYISPSSNVVYPLDWVLELSDGTNLAISSVRPKQELVGANGAFPAYEGYVAVSGVLAGKQKAVGYGMAEIVPP